MFENKKLTRRIEGRLTLDFLENTLVMEWEENDFDQLLPSMPFNGMGCMLIAIKMQDVAGARQKELTGLSITTGEGGAREDLDAEIELLEKHLQKDAKNGSSARVHPEP